ncbi:MAG: triose-phosphate isomerase [Pseudoruegeria sp.]
MTHRIKIAAGNWKMNGKRSDLVGVAKIEVEAQFNPEIQTVLCLPSTLLDRARNLKMNTGGQDCHVASSGAHTGDISADMLADAGASFVILGHSERRTDYKEADATIHDKVIAAWKAGLTVILCIGETRSDYEAKQTLNVLRRQLTHSLPKGANTRNTVIAYEPIWAIGTGRTPTHEEIQHTHGEIRNILGAHFTQGRSFSILYGGSVSPQNAKQIFRLNDVDGGLIGGASLDAEAFSQIIRDLTASVGELA